MGFRYRKSLKLPGGFRVNFSKSGVGNSWGTKGYRVTKTAKGTTRTTFSIPGTGLSYVEESKSTGLKGTKGIANYTDSDVSSGIIKFNGFEILDMSYLKDLSNHEFTTWAAQFIGWKNDLSSDADPKLLEYADKQMEIIRAETDRREVHPVQTNLVGGITHILPLVYVLWFCGIAVGTFSLLHLIFA